MAALLIAGLAAPAAAGDADEGLAKELEPGRITGQERPFAFLVDPSTPSAGRFSVGYAFGLGSGIPADRPLPVNMATANGSHTFQVAYGITDQLAPYASATLSQGSGDTSTSGTSSTATSYQVGLTWQPTRPGAPFRFSISGAGMHEGQGGASGLTSLAAASYDMGRLRVAGNFRADKIFATGRDAVDAFLLLGASWRTTSFLRLGAEYVGQDLEETFSSEAEGGARHAIGPTVALDLDGGRYQVAVGSGFGLTARSPRALMRAALAFNF
ncbi:MAG TPA: hypothetical protein VML50_09810 [Anaeromyxobacter sp.]|nr:hypothetical protein [Anaeromyxobacter sp.]